MPSPATPEDHPSSDHHHLSPEHLAAFRALLESHRRLTTTIEARQAIRDLPLNQYDVLVHLSEAPLRRLRMQELSEAVLLSKSGMSRLVERMEHAGLVYREVDPGDGRGIHAVLTERGLAALLDALPAHRRDVIELFADLMSTDEAIMLARVLTRVRDRAARTRN